jgi:hypothetical protein
MQHPRYPRLSSLVTTPLAKHVLPTGKWFGCSTLNINQVPSSVFPLVSSAIFIAECTPPVIVKQSSPLIIEVGKILLLALWLWCSIGANFCFNSINALAAYCTSDV